MEDGEGGWSHPTTYSPSRVVDILCSFIDPVVGGTTRLHCVDVID